MSPGPLIPPTSSCSLSNSSTQLCLSTWGRAATDDVDAALGKDSEWDCEAGTVSAGGAGGAGGTCGADGSVLGATGAAGEFKMVAAVLALLSFQWPPSIGVALCGDSSDNVVVPCKTANLRKDIKKRRFVKPCNTLGCSVENGRRPNCVGG